MQEEAVLFSQTSLMVGIYTKPGGTHAPRDAGFICLSAGLLHRPGPFRLHVNLATSLSAQGYHVLRVDQSGKGDSARRAGSSESARRQDVGEYIAFLKGKGVNRIVLLGLCSGADDAFWTAPDRDDIAGMVLLDGYTAVTTRHKTVALANKLKGALSLEKWRNKIVRLLSRLKSQDLNEEAVADLRDFPDRQHGISMYQKLVDKGVKLLCVFTGGVSYYYNHKGQLAEFINHPNFGAVVTEIFFPAANHTYPIVADREALIRCIGDWAREHFP